jgi:hypothetical protein
MVNYDARIVNNAKMVIEQFTRDVKGFMEEKNHFKETIEKVVLYRDMIKNQLKDIKDQPGQKFADLRKSLDYLTDVTKDNANVLMKQVGYKLNLILKDCQDFSTSLGAQVEKVLKNLILYGRRGASYPHKLLNELHYVIDLSTRISKSVLSLPGRIKDESLATMDYLLRRLEYKINAGETAIRNHFKLLAYDLGNAVAEGATNHIRRTAQRSLQSIGNAEIIVYNTAFESAERVGAGIYFGLKRELLSDIFQIIFLVIPTFIVGAYIYHFAAGDVDIE